MKQIWSKLRAHVVHVYTEYVCFMFTLSCKRGIRSIRCDAVERNLWRAWQFQTSLDAGRPGRQCCCYWTWPSTDRLPWVLLVWVERHVWRRLEPHPVSVRLTSSADWVTRYSGTTHERSQHQTRHLHRNVVKTYYDALLGSSSRSNFVSRPTRNESHNFPRLF